jgi:hypothetical protein
MDACCPRYVPVVGSHGYSKELSGSIPGRKFLDQLSDHQLLMMDSGSDQAGSTANASAIYAGGACLKSCPEYKLN